MTWKKHFLVALFFCTAVLARDLGYEITHPGQVDYELERYGAPKEGLRVEALVLGHGGNGSTQILLKSEPLEIIPSGPSSTQLVVSESNFAQWKKKFQKITAGLQVLPKAGSKIQWEFENMLTPEEAAGPGFKVHGRWVAK